MKKNYLSALIVLWVSGVALGNTCSGIVVDQVTHNSARFTWLNDSATDGAQIQYGATSSYGSTQGDSSPLFVAAGGMRFMTLTGLQGATTYHAAPQSTTGSAYCTAVDQTFTTLASPLHPVYPTPPTTFTISAPLTPTGKVHLVSPLTCTNVPNWNALYGGSSCVNESSLAGAILTSQATGVANATYGDVIVLQAGSVSSFDGSNQATTMTLADAPDTTKIIGFVASTGTFSTASAHGLSVGNQVILGGEGPISFGLGNDSAPLPFNPGYAYFVASVPSSTTFTVSATNGGSTVLGLGGTSFSAPVYGCFVKTTTGDVPAEAEIIIRTSTPDSQLSPFGVRTFTDANQSVLYPSLFATIQNATTIQNSAVRLDQGCLAHHYRFIGIKWAYAALGTTGEYDGPVFNQFVSSSAGTSHITFDRNWMAGNAYPERDNKWCLYCDGRYMAWVGNVFDNMNLWTPSWSATPLALASGAEVTIPPGNFYFGEGTSDKLVAPSGGALTITAGGGVTGSAVFEATRTGFFLTVPTGLNATCAITGQTCTVIAAASPIFATSGGFYSRVPVAILSISGGAWAGVNELEPVNLALTSAGQEGSTIVAIDKGPGPYMFQGNLFHNNPGTAEIYADGSYAGYVSELISACTTAGLPTCQWLTTPGNLVAMRNTFQIDPAYLANEGNSAWNGRFYSMRQHMEWKAFQQSQVIGNTFTGAFCSNFSGRGFNMSFSNIGGVPTTSSDHEVGWNTFSKSCQGVQLVGMFPGVYGEVASQRIWLHDNIFTGVNRYAQTTFNTSGAPGDNGQALAINIAPQDLTIEHNLFDINQGTSPSNNFVCFLDEGLAFRNNIFGYSNDDSLNGWWYSGCGGNPSPASSFGSALLPVAAPFNLIWNHNLLLGGFSNSGTQTQMTSANIATQSALWGGLPTTTFATGNTIAARVAAIGFTAYSAGRFQLTAASAYVSGGASRASDGLDLGPDTIGQCVKQGCVLNVRPRAIGTTSAIVSFVAPDAFGCTVDISTNGLATFTRVSNSGGGRVQDVSITGLAPATTYTYRVNCAVQQPMGTFTTI